MLEGERLARLAEHGAAMHLDHIDQADEGPGAIETLDLRALASVEPRPKHFIIPALAPAGEVTLFTGPGSAGKSLLAQQMISAFAAGVPTLGLDMGQGAAVYLTCEDDVGQLHYRQAYICNALGVPMADLHGKLALASLRGALDNALIFRGSNGEWVLTPAYERLSALIWRTGAKLVALDNVAHLFTGNENDRGEVTRFVNALNRLAGETGAAILLLGHPNKGGDSYSGSTAWLNAVRSHFSIAHDEETDVRTITLGKSNYSRKGEQLRFVWCDWAFVLEGDLPADTAHQLRETAKAQSENAAFLACLRARDAQGEGRRVGPSSGHNYAPAQFEGMPEAKGFKRDRLRAAMDRLFMTGAIETYQWRNKAKGREVTLIREVPLTAPERFPISAPIGTSNAARSQPDHTPPHTPP
jgi:RecA-family ATPase